MSNAISFARDPQGRQQIILSARVSIIVVTVCIHGQVDQNDLAPIFNVG